MRPVDLADDDLTACDRVPDALLRPDRELAKAALREAADERLALPGDVLLGQVGEVIPAFGHVRPSLADQDVPALLRRRIPKADPVAGGHRVGGQGLRPMDLPASHAGRGGAGAWGWRPPRSRSPNRSASPRRHRSDRSASPSALLEGARS